MTDIGVFSRSSKDYKYIVIDDPQLSCARLWNLIPGDLAPFPARVRVGGPLLLMPVAPDVYAYTHWGQVAQGAMGSVAIVIDPPRFDLLDRILQRYELLDVQTFVPQSSVQRLYVPVLIVMGARP